MQPASRRADGSSIGAGETQGQTGSGIREGIGNCSETPDTFGSRIIGAFGRLAGGWCRVLDGQAVRWRAARWWWVSGGSLVLMRGGSLGRRCADLVPGRMPVGSRARESRPGGLRYTVICYDWAK